MPEIWLLAKNFDDLLLQEIDILNFKNIRDSHLEFTGGVNCLLGMNGMGKSNMLEAIHYLCMLRPMTSFPDSSLICHGTDSMMVKGKFITDGNEEDLISCGLYLGKPKRIKRNGKEYKKLSQHIGRYPIVGVTPADNKIAVGSAEERRKLMDMIISQADAVYLDALIRYGKGLDSRNRLLRASVNDPILFESIETSMAETSAIIHEARHKWLNEMSAITSEIYARISGRDEELSLSLKSNLNDEPLQDLFNKRRQKDILLGYTSAGPHRDDMIAILDGFNIRETGSQGQLKTFIVALKLAVFRYLKKVKGTVPILLLDDIFDKLDSSRVANIMKEVSSGNDFRQIFITDTNRKHLDDIVAGLSREHTLINVNNGVFTRV